MQGITVPYSILIVLSVIGVAISIYLTNHYMDVKFPQGLVEASACDINKTFNCTASTTSSWSNIGGIPISTFGVLFFINLIASCIFPYARWERANHLLARINVGGCAALFLYTLFSLNSACPFCIGHWVVSLLVALLFWKKALPPALPDMRVTGLYALLAVLVVGGMGWNIADKQKTNQRLTSTLIYQFNQRPTVEEPESGHIIHLSTKTFKDAPLRLSEFSDFQCPSCLAFAENIPKLIERYDGKINIQYLFYPLDHNCNDKIKNPFHPIACQASVLAHCSGDKFVTVHDEIFAAQRSLTQSWIDKKAKELGLGQCLQSPEALEFVKSHIQLANKLKVESTPTLIVNGKKIPGSLPLEQLFLLFDEILKQ